MSSNHYTFPLNNSLNLRTFIHNILMWAIFFYFCGDKSPFCGATGTLCFGLQLTLPMGFKARVDPSSPVLCYRLLACNDPQSPL